MTTKKAPVYRVGAVRALGVNAGRASETFEALSLKEDKAAHEVVREATGHSPARYAASLYEASKVMSYALIASSRSLMPAADRIVEFPVFNI